MYIHYIGPASFCIRSHSCRAVFPLVVPRTQTKGSLFACDPRPGSVGSRHLKSSLEGERVNQPLPKYSTCTYGRGHGHSTGAFTQFAVPGQT